MSTFKISKVLSALPDPLVANMVYAVRVGTGYDLYITDSTGLIAYKSNASIDGQILTNAYTASRTSALVDLGRIAEITASSAATFTVDPSITGNNVGGIVAQGGVGQITVLAAGGGSVIKGGPTAKTAQQGSAIWWHVDNSGGVHAHGEVAAS